MMPPCNLLNTMRDGRLPSEFTSEEHVHVLVRQGEMQFSDGKQSHVSQKDDLVIWQMSNAIQDVTYSDDFEADFLIASGEFLSRFNPEMVWASKGFVFIRINPCIRMDHVLCHLRTRLATQRPVEDVDRGGRPDAL